VLSLAGALLGGLLFGLAHALPFLLAHALPCFGA